MNIHQKLKERRLELGLTMLEVAKKTGVSEATVSRWESGDIANMRRDKIVLLARALNVHPSFIMDEDEYIEPASNGSDHPSYSIPDTYSSYNSSTDFSRLRSAPINLFDDSAEDFIPTNNEMNMILKYRAHPEKQPLIDKILNIKRPLQNLGIAPGNENAALKYVLYGDDSKDITTEMLEQIWAYAQFLKEKRKKQ